jgi:hypothetical protein
LSRPARRMAPWASRGDTSGQFRVGVSGRARSRGSGREVDASGRQAGVSGPPVGNGSGKRRYGQALPHVLTATTACSLLRGYYCLLARAYGYRCACASSQCASATVRLLAGVPPRDCLRAVPLRHCLRRVPLRRCCGLLAGVPLCRCLRGYHCLRAACGVPLRGCLRGIRSRHARP